MTLSLSILAVLCAILYMIHIVSMRLESNIAVAFGSVTHVKWKMVEEMLEVEENPRKSSDQNEYYFPLPPPVWKFCSRLFIPTSSSTPRMEDKV